MEPQTFLKGEKPHRPTLMSLALPPTRVLVHVHPGLCTITYSCFSVAVTKYSDQEHYSLFCLNIAKGDLQSREKD